MDNINQLQSDLERVEYLQNTVISIATGGDYDPLVYTYLRQYFLEKDTTKPLIPSFIRISRDTAQLWHFIKYKFPTYAERRKFIWSEFGPLIEILDNSTTTPSDNKVETALRKLESTEVQRIWDKALQRRDSDPEGAITIARTLLETVCKLILNKENIEYDVSIELPELYHLVSLDLNLAPSQHTEAIFKKILGGCSVIVDGLGNLRNKMGDAHSPGKQFVVPAVRHAELAVNLAGAMSMFLVETWLHKSHFDTTTRLT